MFFIHRSCKLSWMRFLRESTTAQGVSSKDTWTTNVTYAASKEYRAKKKDSKSCTHVSCLQWWNYHCWEWYHLKNKGQLPAVIAMGVNSREIYGCHYPGRGTEWSHWSFIHLLFRYLWKQLGWPTLWDGGQEDMRRCLVTAALHAGPCWIAKYWKSLQDTRKERLFLFLCHPR